MKIVELGAAVHLRLKSACLGLHTPIRDAQHPGLSFYYRYLQLLAKLCFEVRRWRPRPRYD